jgi:hypothetical protein
LGFTNTFPNRVRHAPAGRLWAVNASAFVSFGASSQSRPSLSGTIQDNGPGGQCKKSLAVRY